MRSLALIGLSLIAPLAGATQPVEIDNPSFGCHKPGVGVELPKSLSALRQIGVVQSEELVRTEEWDGYQALEKRLQFNGLTLQVITFTNQPERYILSLLEVTMPNWSVTPIRVGQAAGPALSGLAVSAKRPYGVWRINGETDTLLIQVRGGKVERVLYECYTG